MIFISNYVNHCKSITYKKCPQYWPEKGIYRAYVLMSLPIGEANQALMEKIRANKALYGVELILEDATLGGGGRVFVAPEDAIG